jgi:hypothetical protein
MLLICLDYLLLASFGYERFFGKFELCFHLDLTVGICLGFVGNRRVLVHIYASFDRCDIAHNKHLLFAIGYQAVDINLDTVADTLCLFIFAPI